MKKNVDLLVIGGGPAGLCAAQYGARGGLKTLLAEGAATGGQALLIGNLENYPGYAAGVSGFSLMEVFESQARSFGAEIILEEAQSLEMEGDCFLAALRDGSSVSAKAVIAATGASHKKLGISGEERLGGFGVSYCASCDGPFFKGKKIFVVGGGDAACQEACFLSGIAREIVLLVRKSEFRAQKILSERVLQKKNIKVSFNKELIEIKGAEKVSSAVIKDLETDSVSEEAAAGVFIFAGITPNNGLFTGASKIPLALDENGFIKTDEFLRTSKRGVFAAGDARGTPFRQVLTAAADGALAAKSAADYILRGV